MDETGKPQTAVTWVRKNSKHTGSKKTVLIMLADFIDDGNNCPSQKELAAVTGLAKSTVQQALGELEKDGTIVNVTNGGKNVRGGRTNCYRLAAFMSSTVPAKSTPVESIPQESSPSESVPPESTLSPEPVEYTPAPDTHERDATTRVKNNSSAREKEKDKKPLPPASPGSGEVIPEKVRAQRQRDPLFDAIGAHIFNIPPDSKEAIARAAPRIARMQKEFPADKTTLTPERIAQFARWWDANKRGHDGKPISKPLSAQTLAKHWSDFDRANPLKPNHDAENAARLEANRRAIEEANRRQQLEMLGALP